MPKNVPIEFERKVQITDEALALMNAGDPHWDTKIHAKYQIPRAQLITILGDRRNGRGRFSRLDHFHRDKPTATPIPAECAFGASRSPQNAPNLAYPATSAQTAAPETVGVAPIAALTPAPDRDANGLYKPGITPLNIGGRTKAETWALRELAGFTGLAVRTQGRIIEMLSVYVERIFNGGRFTFDLEEAKQSEGELVYVDLLLLEKLYGINDKLLNRVSGTPPKRLIVEMNREEDEGDAQLQQAVEKMPEDLRRTLADSLAPLKIV